MHPTFFIVPLVALVPITIFLYVYLGNMCRFFGLDKRTWKVRGGILGILAVMVFFSHSFFSRGFIGIIHVIVIALIMMAVNFAYRKINHKSSDEGLTKKDSNLWQKIYGCRLVPIVAAFLIMAFGVYNMHDIHQRNYVVETSKGLKQDYKVAMIADLHMGTTMNPKELKKATDRINAEKPDMMVICGDLFDEQTSKKYMEETCKLIGDIQTKYGIYYIYGNHDAVQFIWKPEYTAKEMEAALMANNIIILKDETVEINDDFYLTGRKDAAYLLAERRSPKELLDGLDRDKFRMVLDHQPITFKETSKAGADLQLSGHTHAGQIWPLGIFAQAFGFSDLNEGYTKIGKMQAIVTSGLGGFGTDIRTESNSAFEIITIKSDR